MIKQPRSPLNQTMTTDFFDVLGPLVKPLMALSRTDTDYCLLQSIFPNGVVVPLHSHAERETFYILEGKVEGWCQGEWRSFGAGEVFDVPGNARHALRNFSGEPALLLLVTTMRMGRFFTEMGRPATASVSRSPTQAELERLAALARDYGHWLGGPEENAAVGLVLGEVV